MKRDFAGIADWSAEKLTGMLDLSKKMKADPEKYARSLQGKSVALIFEKQSLRTHVTFEIGIKQLGADTVYLTQADISLGKRESNHDVAKNLERWVDAIVIRTFSQKNIDELARYAKVSVINALSDFEHPCQAVGDFMTIREHLGSFKGKQRMPFTHAVRSKNGNGFHGCDTFCAPAGSGRIGQGCRFRIFERLQNRTLR
jgi:ornithine carbamoyltransferase